MTRLTPSARRSVERGAKFGILPFVRQQLLVRGERHHRVADFVGEAVGHGLDQAQVGGLDFQALQLLALGQVFGHQQRGSRQPGCGRWKGTMLML